MNIFKRMVSVFKKHDDESVGHNSINKTNDKPEIKGINIYLYLNYYVINNAITINYQSPIFLNSELMTSVSAEKNLHNKVIHSTNKYTVYKDNAVTVIIYKSGYYKAEIVRPNLLSDRNELAIDLLIKILNCQIDLNIDNKENYILADSSLDEYVHYLSKLRTDKSLKEFHKAIDKLGKSGIKTSDLKGIHDEIKR